MTLAQLMQEHADAKVEFEKALFDARAEGIAEATKASQELVAKIAPKLKSDSYSDTVKDYGIKVLTGEASIESFEAVIVMTDQEAERIKAEAAKKETSEDGETAPEGGDDATADQEFEAKKKRLGSV
jgi:hypothetical protein